MSDKVMFDKVKENYGRIANSEMVNVTSTCCEPATEVDQEGSCCESGRDTDGVLSLGCYSKLIEKANLNEGDVVLDLGSGPGHDLIQAAEIVGSKGRAIGVDMTDEMIILGKKNTAHLSNVEILKGNLQDIPLPDNSVDVIISNCVFNLAPDKLKAFTEAYRVLKPGGRIIESDIALDYELTEEEKNQSQVYSGCIGGAISIDEYQKYMGLAGFSDIKADTLFKGKYRIMGKDYEYNSVLFQGKK
jgi:ubiquinone/menaquinone biosynthesis C-methylase UbiE